MEASIRYGQFVSVMRDGLQLVRQGELRNGLQTLRSAITLASDLIGTKGNTYSFIFISNLLSTLP